jgi:hypothetical protein
MSDRCYMEVRCFRKDAEVFRDLGFDTEFEVDVLENCSVIDLVDHEAPDAHQGGLPADVVFIASNGSNPGAISQKLHVGNGHSVWSNEGEWPYVAVKFDKERDEFDAESLRDATTFAKRYNEVRSMFSRRIKAEMKKAADAKEKKELIDLGVDLRARLG